MIKRLRVTVDGKSYDVVVETPQETAAAAAPAQIAAPPPPMSAPPAAAPTPVAAPPPPTPAHSGTPGDVPSPMSGRVTAVVVQTGQAVKEGDHLVTLEAMKMNTFVFAPQSGKITAIKIEVGSVVGEGQMLVTIG
jgi:biotin carboxyl carrier protein